MSIASSQDVKLIRAARDEAAALVEKCPASDARLPDLCALTPSGVTIPGCDIVEELQRGGQGVVYLAVQRAMRRKVAVKVMKEGPFASAMDKARFDREVQLLGQLKHPNIVTIHGTGIAAGHYYFVMDYIEGRALDVFVGDGHRAVRDVLRLFVKICDAVAAAHVRGIFHRDLKPSNIRVDEAGEPHILDFGLARSTPINADASFMTMTGQFVGSLPWASPEQAEGIPGKIDVRTDVYSLGVMLYQMLTGRFPYDVVGNMRNVLDRILHAEPRRPRALRIDINDEVETILLRCLEKEPERRYQSAGELACDLRHYLSGEPIEAKRDSTVYVLRKQLRKHRIPVAIAAAFLIVVTAGLVTSMTGWRQAASQRDAAVEARAEAEEVNKFLSEMLGSGSPYAGGGRNVTVTEFLDRASQSLEQRFSDRPLVRAKIHDSIGSAYETLKLIPQARAHTQASLDLRKQLLPADHLDLAASLSRHAQVIAGDEPQPAEELARQALDVRRRRLGPRHPVVAESLQLVGHVLLQRGQLDEAETVLREALDQRLEFLGREDNMTAYTMNFLAAVLVEKGRHEEAQRILREAISIRIQLQGEQHADVASCLAVLGESLASSGDAQEGLAALQSALDIRRAVFKSESQEVANSLSGLCTAMVGLERYEEAEPLCRENLRVRREVYGERHPTMTFGLTGLGRLYVRWPKPGECEAPLREAADILAARQPEHWRLAWTKGLLGACLARQGRFEEAEPLLVESFPRIRAVKGDHDRTTIELSEYLEELNVSQARPERAAEFRLATQ